MSTPCSCACHLRADWDRVRADEARLRVLFDRLGTDLTRDDFVALCLACADQADVAVRDQRKIEKILTESE